MHKTDATNAFVITNLREKFEKVILLLYLPAKVMRKMQEFEQY